MIYATNLQKNIYDIYFKDVRDMNDFNNALQTIPFETLCVLGKEVFEVNDLTEDKINIKETLLYKIITENGFIRFHSFLEIFWKMTVAVEHEFLIRCFKEEHFND